MHNESHTAGAEQVTQDALEAFNKVPTFIYSYNIDQLHRTSLVTRERSSHRVPSYTFKSCCCWSEVPGGSLLITGGGFPTVREVVRIDTRLQSLTVLLCSLLDWHMLQCITHSTPLHPWRFGFQLLE
jgi:hypothetical protein